MQWPEREAHRWSDRLGLLGGVSGLGQASRQPYIFRGRSDRAWTLEPTLKRAIEPTGSRQAALDIEKRLEQEFTSRAHMHISAYLAESTKDRADCWAMMRHYGAPTRLLDWTSSPYVAASFACASAPKTDGVIWCVHVQMLNGCVNGATPPARLPDGELGPAFFDADGPSKVVAIGRSTQIDRMLARQGSFTICTDPLADHADAMNLAATADNPSPAMKLVIGSHLKRDILRQLRVMNISAASLFPGLEGLARSLHDAARLAADFGC